MKVDLTKGVRCPLSLTIGNRSDESVTLRLNYVDLVNAEGVTVASSAAGTYEVTIEPYKESTMLLDVWIPTTFFSTLVKSIFQSISQKDTTVLKETALKQVQDATVKASATVNGVLSVDINVKIASTQTVTEESVQGLGLTNTENRKIYPLEDYIYYIPSRANLFHSDKVLTGDRNVTPEETAQFIRKVAQAYKADTAVLAKQLKRATVEDTVQCIWDFVARYIKYVPDDKFCEQVRRPLRTLYDQRGDCDCYTTLIASICENLGLKYVVRIAEYENRGYYQHVYPIIEGYVCDVVYTGCFREKKPSKFLDF